MAKKNKKVKKEKKVNKNTPFITDQEVKFTLVDGVARCKLGEDNTEGKIMCVYFSVDSNGVPHNSTWSVDLIVNNEEYCQTRTIPNEVTTSWHHIKTNATTTTSATLIIYSTSGLEDAEGSGKVIIKINN